MKGDSSGARSASSTATIRSGRSGCPTPGLCNPQAGCHTTVVVTLVVQVMALQQVANRGHFLFHVATGGIELGQGAPVAAPSRDHQHDTEDARGARPHEQGTTPRESGVP